MKNYIYLLGMTLMLILFFVGCSDNSQSPVTPTDQGLLDKVTTTYFSMTNYPTGLTGEGTIKLVGNNWIMKDVGIIEQINSVDPVVAGTMTHYLSARINAVTGEGSCNGHWSIIPQANTGGGVWEGIYEGYRSKMPGSDTLFVLPLHVVGQGRGGTIDGMQVIFDATLTVWGTPPVGWYGSGEGFYKSHEN